MKVIVQKIDLMRIVAETDSDEAILRNLWNGPQKTIQQIGLEIGDKNTGTQLVIAWNTPPLASTPNH